MTDRPAKPVLMTGASGNLGRALTKALAAEGWTLRLTDITPFPDAIPSGASFTQADLNDGVTICAWQRVAARSCISAACRWSDRSRRCSGRTSAACIMSMKRRAARRRG